MRNGTNKQRTFVLKGNKTTVEKMVNGRREQQSVGLEQPLTVVRFSPGFDVTRDQMFGPVNAGDPTEPFHVRDFLAEQPLAASRINERLLFGVAQLAVFRNTGALVLLPFNNSAQLGQRRLGRFGKLDALDDSQKFRRGKLGGYERHWSGNLG